MKTPTKFKMGKSKGNFNFNKANDYNLDKYGPSAGETVAGKKFAAFQMKNGPLKMYGPKASIAKMSGASPVKGVLGKLLNPLGALLGGKLGDLPGSDL